MFVRTVTRAFTLSWMPFLATASIVCRPSAGSGHVDDLGVHAGLHGVEDVAAGQVDRGGGLPGRSMLALLAAIIALITRCTSPPARTWVSISGVVTAQPGAASAWMRALTMAIGVDLPQPHADQVDEADVRAADRGPDVQADELAHDRQDHQQDDQHEDSTMMVPGGPAGVDFSQT